jgi:hypothetical protein
LISDGQIKWVTKSFGKYSNGEDERRADVFIMSGLYQFILKAFWNVSAMQFICRWSMGGIVFLLRVVMKN